MGTIWAIVGLIAFLDGPPPRIERLTSWVDAVMSHRPGDADAALQRVAAMSIADIQALSIDAQTLVTLMRRPGALVFFVANGPEERGDDLFNRGGPGKKQRQIQYRAAEIEPIRALAKRLAGHDNEFLRRAALLEADVAMLDTIERVPIAQAPPGGPVSYRVKVNDGQTQSINQGPVHWGLARKMIDLLTPSPSRDLFAHAWYVATVAQLEAAEQYDTDHLEKALALFPTDARLLFFNGCLHEVYASDRIQAAVRTMRLPPGLSLGVGTTRTELQLAEASLKKAVAADPEAAEARLHLGHVLGLLGHHQEAAAELRRAVEAVGDPLNEYHAAMFLGREEETLGRLDAAQASYERAASLHPGAQSAHLALSQLAWRRPDRTAALQAVRDALSSTAEDPWWTYALVHAHHADALLEELRRPFLEKRP